jgi:hypothetical protein
MKPLSLMPLLILIIQTLLFTTACKQSTEPKLEAELKLELEDASCTEAWIKLSATNLQFPATINLLKDGNVAQTISLWRDADTVLYVDSLLPNQTYKFKSIVQSSNQQINTSSNELTVTTMDTTSHEFSWQSWEFGTTGSSRLYDVAIIDENDIWAVGEINIADTSMNGYTTYNAVHWDGTKWELKRIYFPTVCGSTSVTSYPAKAIFTFDDGQIWISSSGDKIARLQNGVQIDKFCLPSNVSMSINKLWGSSSENLYAVGNNGNIAHWDGRKWTKIESGTDLNFIDIYGSTDSKTGEQQILAVCTRNLPLDKGIYRIEGNTATQISSAPIQWELFALWFIPNRHYYVVGSGIYEKKFLSDSTWKNGPLDITHYGTTGIRGNELNNVFVAGAFGEFLHFNGITWKSYINELGWFNGSYGGVALKDNMVITVGYESAKAKILIGKK